MDKEELFWQAEEAQNCLENLIDDWPDKLPKDLVILKEIKARLDSYVADLEKDEE